MPRIVAYARQTWGLDLFTEALRLFFMSRTPPESNRSAMPTFERWFAFTWVPDWRDDFDDDDCGIPESWPTASLGVSWLASQSATASDFEQAFILTAAKSPYSLLLVEGVAAGWWLAVRDLLTGRQFRVVDPELSECVRPEEVLLGAVLTLEGVSTLLGCAAHAVPSDLRVEVLEMRRCHTEGAWLTRAELVEIAPEVSSE